MPLNSLENGDFPQKNSMLFSEECGRGPNVQKQQVHSNLYHMQHRRSLHSSPPPPFTDAPLAPRLLLPGLLLLWSSSVVLVHPGAQPTETLVQLMHPLGRLTTKQSSVGDLGMERDPETTSSPRLKLVLLDFRCY